jgi:hypothetical protein
VCYTTGPQTKACSGCEVVHYCSPACKTADMSIHRQECKALQTTRRFYQSQDVEKRTYVRMVARLIWKREQLGQEWYKGIENLMPHREKGMSHPTFTQGIHLLLQYLGLSNSTSDQIDGATLARLGFSSIEEVKDIYCRVVYNDFEVNDHLQQRLGKTLSSVAATLNHSCNPNVVVVFPEGPGVKKCLHIIAVKNVTAGEELTVSYINHT